MWNAAPPLDEIIAGPPLPELVRACSLGELILAPAAGDDDRAPILLGVIGARAVAVTLGGLRQATVAVAAALAASGLRPGDTLALARLPRTSETAAALVYLAASAAGLRVLFPMYLEPAALEGWLRASGARALASAAAEVAERGAEAARELAGRVAAAAAAAAVPCLCFDADLGVAGLDLGAAGPAPGDARVAALLAAAGGLDSEALVLTTSGTSGAAKLIRYRQRGLLGTCHAWEAAGLFAADRLGGRALCLLLGHSMGLRALWNAVWTREAVCLPPPEWFAVHPERVQELLAAWRPEHITGGPGVYRTLLDLGRAYPALKETCLRHLRLAVCSGARFDAPLAARLRGALGVPLANAFGMTETMQALTTLVPGPFGVDAAAGALGNPLPGVRVGLEAAGGGLHRLHIAAEFGATGALDGDAAGAWLATGDLVRRETGGLCHAGREAHDFVKDAFGVKVPRALLLERYLDLGEPVLHVETEPLAEEPGLGALVFVAAPGAADGELVAAAATTDAVRALFERRHERLADRLEDFEHRHLTVARFACVAGPPPRTVKGTVARPEVERRHAALLAALLGRPRELDGLVRLDRARLLASRHVRFASPHRGALLHAARLDLHYDRGAGDTLETVDRGVRRRVLDFVGGFGGNLLGHRHPAVLAAAAAALQNGEPPLFDQGSWRRPEGELCRRLALLVGEHTGGSYVVRLASTGAEAVELALAHGFLERLRRFERRVERLRRECGAARPDEVAALVAAARARLAAEPPRVLAVGGAFHGHTTAARALLGRARSRALFSPLVRLEPIHLAPDRPADIDAVVAAETLALPWLARDAAGEIVAARLDLSRVFAAIAEPIRGEGGVEEVPKETLRRLSGHDFPLILDEIQCGLGRSGDFLASRGVRGGAYLFGKALGGGVAKIAAVAIARERYQEEIEEHFASTFAGDAFSSRVAAAVLDVVERDDVPGRAAAAGAALGERLGAVARAYPDVIAAVRGRGLMLGVALDAAAVAGSFTLRLLAEHELLGAAAASYLLHRHGLRLLPTLSAPATLRVEPSAYIDAPAIAALGAGVEALAGVLRAGDSAALLGHLVEDELALGGAAADGGGPADVARVEAPAPGAARFAFVAHFIDPERELGLADPSLRRLPAVARRALADRLAALVEGKPTVAAASNLLGGRVWMASILLPYDAATLEELHRRGERARVVERIQRAVDLGARLGARVVALGAYTSILSADGASLHPPPGVRITTGNALTAVVGARRLLAAAARRGDPARMGLAVVGASGNIGAALSRLLAASFARTTLIGRDRGRLDALQAELGAKTQVATDVAAVRGADAIVVAAGTTEPLVCAHHLEPGRPVLVADLSVPSAVAADALARPEVEAVPLAGTVPVPGHPDFVMAAHIPAGQAFCCAAEGILLALEPERTAGLRLVGPIAFERLTLLDELAVAHGFLPPSALPQRR